MNGSEAADTQLQLPQAFGFEQKTILQVIRQPKLGQIRNALVRLLRDVSKLPLIGSLILTQAAARTALTSRDEQNCVRRAAISSRKSSLLNQKKVAC